jgi:hypothetical protein
MTLPLNLEVEGLINTAYKEIKHTASFEYNGETYPTPQLAAAAAIRDSLTEILLCGFSHHTPMSDISQQLPKVILDHFDQVYLYVSALKALQEKDQSK